jgi:N-formylglutamate amidohydrolase
VPEHSSPRNSHGRGFIWEITTEGTPALARPLSLNEWQQRQKIHESYYAALATAIQRARGRFGFAVLVDGHSMPSRGKAVHTDTGADRAAIVPGDRMGQSCAPALSRLVQHHFLQQGYGVKFNDPYQGGFITAYHGHPATNVHAIQIEMRRDLYMNEITFAKDASGFNRLRCGIESLLRTLDQFDPQA